MVNDTARSIVSRMLLALTLLAVVAVVGLSVDPFYNGNNYCGRVLLDGRSEGACRAPMQERRILFLTGTGVATTAAMASIGLTRRWRLAVPTAMLFASLGLGLVAANRIFDPTPVTIANCGSLARPRMPDDDRQRAYCTTIRRRAVIQGTTAIVISVWFATCAAPLVRNESRRVLLIS